MEEVANKLQWKKSLSYCYGRSSSPAPMEEVVDLKLWKNSWPAAMEEVDDQLQ